MKKTTRVWNLSMLAAGIILCLTLVTLHLVSGLLAKYESAAHEEDDGRVASFYLKEDSDLFTYFDADLIPGDSASHPLQIINDSEVKMNYVLKIQNVEKNLPLDITLENTTTHASVTAVGGIFTIDTSIASNSTDNYELVINWPDNDDPVDPNIAYMGRVDCLKVSVSAVQAD